MVTCRRPAIRSPHGESGVATASSPSAASAARASSRVAFSRLTRRSSEAGSSSARNSIGSMRGASQSGTSSRTASGIDGWSSARPSRRLSSEPLRRHQWRRPKAPTSKIGERSAVQYQRRRNQQPRRWLAMQPPAQPAICPQYAPNAIRYGAPITGSGEAAASEVIVGDRISGTTRFQHQSHQLDRRGSLAGWGHATAERSVTSVTRPRNPYSSGCPLRFTQ